VLISWEAIKDRSSEFYAALLILETGLIGVFCSFDLVLFYVFFEMTLIPLFFLIAIWGGAERRWAAIKFFLYTLAGSLVTLSGLIYVVLHVSKEGLANPTSLPALSAWLAVASAARCDAVDTVSGCFCGLSDQGAGVSVSYLVAAGSRGGSHGRECVAGRRAVETRQLRFSADLSAVVSGRVSSDGIASHRACCR
jgi:hypothetical protein